jgi:tetratricopeptide (TPR) repeat protein
VKELTEAAARGATAPLTTAIVDLSKRLGVTEDATKTLLRIIGEQDVPLERLSEMLHRVANDYKRLQEQAAALNPDNPMARDLVTQARAAIDAGQFEQAHKLLRGATQAQLAAAQAARKLREQAQAAEDAQMLGAASATAVDAGVALTEGKYQQAAELFGQAAEYVPAGHPDERSGYLSGQADALNRQGDERGDNNALRQAIKLYGRVLEIMTRERVPLDWATTQNNLGAALRVLGGRESGPARLEEAVAAFRAALQEWTRERVPLAWATTQSNLGAALATLGGLSRQATSMC